MVNINNTLSPEEQSEEAAWGMLSGRSIRKFDKFADESPVGSGVYIDKPVGTSYSGIVSELPKQYQAVDYDTREPKTYKDNTPIMEVSIVLDVTPDPTDEEDDGKRIVRLGQNGKRALQDEMRRLGIKRFGIGTGFTMQFTGYKPNASGKGRPAKLYNITLTPTEYVAAQQMAVEQALQQNYTQQAVQAGFPAQQPVQAVVPQQVDPAVLAAAQAAQQQALAAQAAQQQVAQPIILQEHVEQARLLINQSGIAREVAIEAVTNTQGGGSDVFRSALDAALDGGTVIG